jgi:predicted PurR-regulated permease PerM
VLPRALEFDRHGVELLLCHVRVGKHSDANQHLAAAGQRRPLFDRSAAKAHGVAFSDGAAGQTSGGAVKLAPMHEHVIRFRLRNVLAVLLLVVAVVAVLEVLQIARQVITWILISLFLALALNPLVEFLQRRATRQRRLPAIALSYVLVAFGITAIAATFLPTLIDEINNFANAVPGYIEDLTAGRGWLGELADRYDIVERVREQVETGGAAALFGASGTALAITREILTAIVGIVTIIFLTFFMLLEGHRWMERFYGLLPEQSQERWRNVGRGIYRTVGGYVSGNLLISLIAGTTSAIVLSVLGVPYAIALGLVVAILDLIPLAGATLAAIILTTIAFLDDITKGIIVLVFFVIYQQVENHILYPIVYSRTVAMSPLAILMAVLLGAELAGVLGALAAIPVAGAVQIVLIDLLEHRRARLAAERAPSPG